MKVTVFISILFIFATLVTSQEAGFKTIVSQKGLNYAKDVGLQVIQREIRGIKIPDQHGRVGTPVGTVEYWITSLQLNNINIPQGSIGKKKKKKKSYSSSTFLCSQASSPNGLGLSL